MKIIPSIYGAKSVIHFQPITGGSGGGELPTQDLVLYDENSGPAEGVAVKTFANILALTKGSAFGGLTPYRLTISMAANTHQAFVLWLGPVDVSGYKSVELEYIINSSQSAKDINVNVSLSEHPGGDQLLDEVIATYAHPSSNTASGKTETLTLFIP